MERVTKTFTGYNKEKENKPATHVILTIEEYESLVDSVVRANNKMKEARLDVENYKNKIEDCKNKANKIIEIENQKAQKHIQDIKNDFDKAKVEIHRLNNLNFNLLRICKERANSKRKLKPKKTHFGYLILDSQEHNHIFKWNGRNTVTESFPCWKVRIQSPYDCSIPYDIIKKNIYDDLLNFIGTNLGLNYIYYDVSKLDKKQLIEVWNNNENFIFKTLYKANNRSSFWEIEYLTKLSVNMPKEMIKNLNFVERT